MSIKALIIALAFFGVGLVVALSGFRGIRAAV